LARVARHHRAAGSTKAWLRTAEAAADRTVQQRTPDPQSAAELLKEALATDGLPGATEVRLARKLAQVAGHLSGLDDTTHTLLERLINSEQLPLGVRGELRRDLALLIVNQGASPQQGLAEMAHAVDELSGRPEPAVRAMVALAMPFLTGVAVAENERWLERAQAAADRSGDPALKLVVLAGRVSLTAEVGDGSVWALARELAAAHALGGVTRIEVLRGLCNAADGVAWLGHYDHADRFIRHALQLASRVGAEFNADLTKGTTLRIDWGRGNWSDLENRAKGLAARNPLSPARPEAHLVAGQLALAHGDWSTAHHQLRAAGLSAPDNGAAPVVTAAGGVLLRGLLDRGELPQARRTGEAAWRRLRTKGVWVWGSELVPSYVELLTRDGELTAAERAVGQFADGIEDRDAPLAASALQLCRALLDQSAGRTGQARTGFAQAAEQYAAVPQPYDAALALERAGRCALDAHQTPDQLVAAERQFDALGAAADAARCGGALQRHGLARPAAPRRGRPAYGTQLSPREREVALLASEGRTNAEIAAELVLSPRTVEQHIAKALRKLSLTSRTELPAALTARTR
ncbi:LuxR C-terminal-related transcriptional regulator, partial [Streptomyces mesophilus]|uniref:LuxR C-terminal-related transcriptional regulator n=1 Tax=Streptomyces mesophilus TaxID=1775132 RepID=UPI00331A04FB